VRLDDLRRRYPEASASFCDFIVEDQLTGCWMWTGKTFETGYGLAVRTGKVCRAHRLMWIMVNGPIEDRRGVCHRCDHPRCVNPSHLFLGTQKDNLQDAKAKGWPNGKPGNHRPGPRLNPRIGRLVTGGGP